MAKTKRCDHRGCPNNAGVAVEWRFPGEKKSYKGNYCHSHGAVISRNVAYKRGELIRYKEIQ